MAQSLFEIIADAVVDGQLPPDFSLPKEPGSNGMFCLYTDGAFDGICLNHMGEPDPLPEEKRELMANAVMEASNGHTENADELFRQLGKSCRALSIFEELQKYIMENESQIQAMTLAKYAIHLMLEATDTESVKFGMTILELFDKTDIEEVKNIVLTLGLSDEFTLFAAFIIADWPDANERLFSLAKKVHQWGRIHLIERIEPETEEIRQWMLHDALENDFVALYSSSECWKKSGAREMLEGELSRKDFCGIRNLITAPLDDGQGPVYGYSRIGDVQEVIMAFFRQAERQALDIEDYKAVLTIRNNFEQEYPEIAARCNEIINTDDCRRQVTEAVRHGYAFELADELGIAHE